MKEKSLNNYNVVQLTFQQKYFSQFSKFNQRKVSLPPTIWLISRKLWGNGARGNCDFICMVAK